jgi:RHS repeat-associated protein
MSTTRRMWTAGEKTVFAWAHAQAVDQIRLVRGVGVLALALLILTVRLAAGADQTSASAPQARPATSVAALGLQAGQRTVLLPDGSTLITGFPGGVLKASGAAIQDGAGGQPVPLPAGPNRLREWHTATVLPDGSVLLLGGVDLSGNVVETAERFDPATRTFAPLDGTGLIARAHQSATLLTDGTVLIAGGVTARDAPVVEAELWNPRTGTSQPLSAQLSGSRLDATATLLSNGTVWIAGGTDSAGRALAGGERYDPLAQQFVHQSNPPAELTQGAVVPEVVGTFPPDGARDVALDAQIALRFNQALQVDSINPNSIRLEGPAGAVDASVVPAESGRLAFLTPKIALQPWSTYTPLLFGAHDALGNLLAPLSFSFQTGTSFEFENPVADSQNTGSARTQAASGNARNLPPEISAGLGLAGASVTGMLKTLDGQSLRNVLLESGGKRTRSDAAGRFTLSGLSAGRAVIWIDGRTANRPGKSYGTFLVGVDLKAGEVTEYPQVMWMPEIDSAHAIRIKSPTTQEVVITNPALPDFELRIPAGTTIFDHAGKPVTEVSITPVPLGKIPFPMVHDYAFKSYYTIQPGGAQLINPQGLKARVIYPNWNHEKPGFRYMLSYYEPDEGWKVYAQAEVGKDGRQIIPEPGAGIYEFNGAGAFAGPAPTTAAPCTQAPCMCPNKSTVPKPAPAANTPASKNNPMCTDPVSISSGIFVQSDQDLELNDVLPISLTRTYVTGDTTSHAFGVGATHGYDMYIWRASLADWSQLVLVFPDGSRVTYNLISGSNPEADDVWQNTDNPGPFYLTKIAAAPNALAASRWKLTLKDGTVWSFSTTGGQLMSQSDRYGNSIVLTRTNGESGSLTRVAAQNGRWIALTYSGNIITQAQDNTGRAWNYTYDGSGRLYTATDPNGGVRYYTYDTSHRMLTFKDARGNIAVTNEYDVNGRVKKQTYPDTGTTQFAYTLDGTGTKVTQTDVTDQRGNVRRVQFDANGYIASDIFAQGNVLQQTYTFTRQAVTHFLTDETDAAGRVTHYTYDTSGNVASVTKLYGTGQAVTWNYTYEPAFNQLATVTDPLSHTTTFIYDTQGNVHQIQDALNHVTTLNYNDAGQVISVSDPLTHATTFGYQFGDLVSVTDALSRTTKLYSDGEGRVTLLTDPLGNQSRTDYDVLDRVTKVTDALGGQVQFGYDANGNLTSHTDQRTNVTHYTYDTLNRLLTRQDALLKTQSYAYDAAGALKQFTDRKNQVSGYTYDALSRRASAGFGATVANPTTYTNTITYGYDTANRLTSAVDTVSGTITRGYDDRFDTLAQEITPQGQVNYTYDAAGRRATMTVLGQTVVSYTFDTANRLTNVIQGTANVVIAYDNANRRSTLTLPNGVVVTYGLDNANELTSLTYTKGVTTLGALNYTYDNAGRRTNVSGSLAATGLPTALASATYDANNRLTVWGGASLTYDDNGNVLTEAGKTYSWDTRNQLSQIAGGIAATFQYDPFGRRVSKTVTGTQTGFLYDGVNFVQEKAGASVSANLLTGLGIDETYSRTQGATTSTLLTDALGSTIADTDSTGAITTQYSFEPYGKTTQTGAANANSQQFTGRENDGTGVYYYRARYYSPTYGRFVTEDPIGIRGGPNGYVYTRANPIRGRDPFGLWSVEAGGFDVIGISTTFGVDHATNIPFWTVQIGVGVGGGIVYDQNGGLPPGADKVASSEGQGLFGGIAKASVVGPGAGIDIVTAAAGVVDPGGGYGGISWFDFAWMTRWGFKAEASAALQFGIIGPCPPNSR